MGQNNDHSSTLMFLLRVSTGLILFFAGLGHVDGIEGYTGLFTTIGIPMPDIMAPFVAWLELIGGIGLVLGALTRVFSPLLAFVMLMAMVTFKIPNAYGVFSEQAREATAWSLASAVRVEFLLMLLCITFLVLGPGKHAIDSLLSKGSSSAGNATTADESSSE